MATAWEAMNVQQAAETRWEHEASTVRCKRLRPLTLSLSTPAATPSSESNSGIATPTFIRCPPRKAAEAAQQQQATAEAMPQAQVGSTRWNPTQEQIAILEMLYRGGMRTPNAQQIEHITAQLGRYGKIEGKNVFYWFQNHKARERQKQKRTSGALTLGLTTTTTIAAASSTAKGEGEGCFFKRKCRSWALQSLDLEEEERSRFQADKTLELFPLHPEAKEER
ncbi:WUSCHEL-related homeobox 4 [Amborella trichopoda]|uniref:Homeobox domain-containing protein n=1 Tax=Amborella trichopoda TaxID=13333 RepID=U5CTL8_AMBTC|nr:WUSCHEL-related homeobox 4 [Amborella trichopoda]ERN16606.1 hypothetical protein AMTR_s00051p00020930 [Amborella trichopoda]|eukprot:XP_006855139.1 WUSCHEL-related homeobox 4 [Amborella trichopoda]